jgi:Uma2 family endonuclease
MTDITLTQTDLLPENLQPYISHLVTGDDRPLDILSEKQQRLLTQTLYSSWSGISNTRGFLVAANVGIFTTAREPPIVPDVFLSVDVELAENLQKKCDLYYLLWEFGKPPEVVIEIVSNQKGNEKGRKIQTYARMRVIYYVIFDPTQQLGGEVLEILELRGREYVPVTDNWLAGVELGLCLWEGVFEGVNDTWLRWCDAQGNIIPTGAERAEQEKQAKEAALQRAERLAAQLKALGIEPEV